MGDSDTPSLELYVRSLAADAGTSRVGEVLDRIARLDADGDIDGYEVTVWGEGVSLDERVQATDAARTIRGRVEEFRRWAEETGRTLAGFETRSTESSVTGEVRLNLTVPTLTLAERRGGSLTWVAPCHDGTPHTVRERLDQLADGRDDAPRERYALEAAD